LCNSHRQQANNGPQKHGIEPKRLALCLIRAAIVAQYLEQAEYSNEMQKISTGEIDIVKVQGYRKYINDLFAKIELHKKVITQLNNQLEKKKEALIESTKKVKILEKLKEKRFNQFVKEQEYEELKVLDEIGKNQFLQQKIAMGNRQ